MTGQELRSERKRLGQTQKQMADGLGVSVSTLQCWERGVTGIGKFQGRGIADYLLQEGFYEKG